MRNLTITRHKSFVGFMMKDKVYIEDPLTPDTTINGVPCRKLGTLKNGQTQTFQIGSEARQLFLVADNFTKDHFFTNITLPEGQDDLNLGGKHRFVFGSNPFQFDGVHLTPEQTAQYKKNTRKGVMVVVAACIIGGIIGALTSGILFKKDDPKPKTFTAGDFSITLTDEFKKTSEDGFDAVFESETAMVAVLREDKSLLRDFSLEEYARLVLVNNQRTDLETHRQGDKIWFSYTGTPDGVKVFYMSFCCESEDAFWLVSFATPASNKDDFREFFLDWAQSIHIGPTEQI